MRLAHRALPCSVLLVRRPTPTPAAALQPHCSPVQAGLGPGLLRRWATASRGALLQSTVAERDGYDNRE